MQKRRYNSLDPTLGFGIFVPVKSTQYHCPRGGVKHTAHLAFIGPRLLSLPEWMTLSFQFVRGIASPLIIDLRLK
jgi:hypothetical protein